MSRLRPRLLAPLVLLALVAAAGCGDDEAARPAATVDGIEISQQDVVDELEAIQGNQAYLDQIQSQRPVLGEEEGTFDTAFVAQLLTTRIRLAVVQSELEERGVEIDDACRQAAEEQVVQQVGGEEVLAGFDDEYHDYLVQRFADLVALQADLAGYPCVVTDDDEALQAYFDENVASFEPNYCVSIIQVATQAEADDIAAQLAAGGDFDQLAADRSATPPAEEPECVPESNLLGVAPEVADLAEGEVSAPVAIQDVFFIFRLDEVQQPSLETSRDAVVGAIGQEMDAAFNEWYAEAIGDAEVDVDPRYGTWNPATGQIDRPAEAGSASTSTTAAPSPDDEG